MAEDEPPQPHGKGILHPEGMRAVRDIAAGIVHEVNNILGVIIGNAHLARKSLSDTTGLERYMGEVRDAAEEGRELMRNLAILAGEAPHRARLLSLNDLVANATSGLGKPVELDLSGEDPTVELDLWLAQDAVSCAVRFMADTKAVTSIRVATRVVGAAAALSMEDDGASLAEKDLRALFTPFAKVDGRPKAGLNLTKLADLASRCGGHVMAAAREPNGLRIVLTLPVASGAASGDGPGVTLPKKRF
jgi:signal transduction histidine kinase